ncbi:MAG: DNA repair protein RecO [Syntrophomonadaceae bacterium]|jgi:DNA repair protein RecO (recombination protein O)
MYYRTRAIVLKNTDIRETDKLVTIFSQDKGKKRVVAKGVKKPGSSLRACVQPFCHSLLFLHSGKELDLITQGRLLDFYGSCRENLNATLHIMYLMELLDKSLLDNLPLPSLFTATLSVLDLFNHSGFNLMVVRYFEMVLMISLGYRPQVDQCAVCQRQEAEIAGFDLAAGGLICPGCTKENGHLLPVNGETIGLLRLLANGNLKVINRVKYSPLAMRQLERLMEKYMEYYLDRKFYMKNTITVLKKAMGIAD